MGKLGEITLEFAFTARLELAPWRAYGNGGSGSRRLVGILGGAIHGPRVNGSVLQGGADWPTVHPGGFLRFDARWSFETNDGALVYAQNRGVRRAPLQAHEQLDSNQLVDPALVYFRTTPIFETDAPAYEWLVQSVFIATGRRLPDGLDLDVYEVK